MINTNLLFRGKKLYGSWTYGSLIVDKFCKHMCIYSPVDNDFFDVVPETVGRRTELRDRKKRLIFEGDILECFGRIVTIEWHGPSASFDCTFIRFCNNDADRNVSIRPSDWKFAEVIGNVHDNPEILEVKNDALD